MRPHTRSALLLALFTLAAGRLATQDQDWYEHYFAAREEHIPEGRCADAIRELKAAVRLKPSSALNQQTYGLQFVDYFPYYYLGLCYLRTGEARSALHSFETEERQGAIKQRARLFKDLQLRRQEAQTEVGRDEQRRLARLAQDKAEALLAQAADLERERRYDEALGLLTQAEKVADVAETATQRQVQERLTRLRGLKQKAEEADALARRIERALVEGRKALDEGRDQDAVVRFDEVLSLDPRNAAADAGKREARDRILAATTRQEREEAFQKGRALFEAGHYDESLPYLSKAAADPRNVPAAQLLERAKRSAEGLRRQREIRKLIEALMADGELLLTTGRFAAAQVKFQDVLRLDPAHVRAREREAYAERRTQEDVIERLRPNRPPAVAIFEPSSSEVEIDAQTVQFEGVATDDRGLSRLEFFVDGRLVAEHTVPPRVDSGGPQQELPIRREFPLPPGTHEIRIRATDVVGLSQEAVFRVSRRLRAWEHPAFVPSALGTALGLVGLGLVAQRVRRARAVKRRFNPYVAGAPVSDDSLFFGRQRVLTRVLNLLHHNSFMITGERRIGKTSFILRLRRALELDDHPTYRFFPVFVDLSGVPEEEFFRAIMSDIVDSLALRPQTLAALRFSPDRTRYEGREFAHDLQQILAELSTRTEKNAKLVLLMDEIDVLNEYSERTNQLLRSIFMKTFSQQVVTVMSGVGVKRAWNSDGSPWYNFFEQIKLVPFTRDDAEALIRNPVAGIFRYEPQAVESILEHSQMKPYLIQKLCIQAVNRILEEDRGVVTTLDVEAVKDAVLAEGEVEPALAARGRGTA